jgi:hypothetical protein
VHPHTQMFVLLTAHKPAGRRWVTKEQYIRFFMMCTRVLAPDWDMTPEEQREALEASDRPHPLTPKTHWPPAASATWSTLRPRCRFSPLHHGGARPL